MRWIFIVLCWYLWMKYGHKFMRWVYNENAGKEYGNRPNGREFN